MSAATVATGVARYRPLYPVLGAYLILFLIGVLVPGMWQMVSLLAFYCALGQSWNIFMGMTGYVDFGYVTFIALGAYLTVHQVQKSIRRKKRSRTPNGRNGEPASNGASVAHPTQSVERTE